LLEGAGWHRAKALVWPEGIHPIGLPAYSPELQAAEVLWPVTNESVVNRPFANLDQLIAAQNSRCSFLEGQPERLRQLTCFHWWPKLDAATV
jgi:transposase